VTVFIEHGGDGSQSAAPIAGNIIQSYFQKQVDQKVQPEKL